MTPIHFVPDEHVAAHLFSRERKRCAARPGTGTSAGPGTVTAPSSPPQAHSLRAAGAGRDAAVQLGRPQAPHRATLGRAARPRGRGAEPAGERRGLVPQRRGPSRTTHRRRPPAPQTHPLLTPLSCAGRDDCARAGDAQQARARRRDHGQLRSGLPCVAPLVPAPFAASDGLLLLHTHVHTHTARMCERCGLYVIPGDLQQHQASVRCRNFSAIPRGPRRCPSPPSPQAH